MSNRNTTYMKSLFRPNIAIMQGYQPGEQPSGDGYIKLNTNENPYPPSPATADAIRGVLEDDAADLRLYPDPLGAELRSAAAEKFDFPLEGVICGNGSDELLGMIVRVFVGPRPQGSILTLYPTYTLYKTLAEIENSSFQSIDFADDFSLPDGLDMMKSRVLLLANPNSPSATAIPSKQIRELAESFSGVLVIDEAYADFAEDNCIDLARECENVIVLRSFSKSYSLAGMRIGLGLGHPTLIEGMMKVKDSYNIDRLALAAGAAALRDPAHMLENRRKILRSREKLTEGLAELGCAVFPSAANFVLAKVPQINAEKEAAPTAKLCFEKLAERRILVRYFNARRLEDCLRITVGTDEEVEMLLGALKEIIDEIKLEADGGEDESE